MNRSNNTVPINTSMREAFLNADVAATADKAMVYGVVRVVERGAGIRHRRTMWNVTRTRPRKNGRK